MSSSDEAFVSTGEYRRFTEFAEAVRQKRYIGLCYGAPGVGKTLSARRYANWDSIEPYLRRRMAGRRHTWPGGPPLTLRCTRTVMWTTPVAVTPRQLEIVSAVALGGTNKEVAQHFSISEETVKRHLSNIFEKLGVFSRLELAIFALNHGLIDGAGS